MNGAPSPNNNPNRPVQQRPTSSSSPQAGPSTSGFTGAMVSQAQQHAPSTMGTSLPAQAQPQPLAAVQQPHFDCADLAISILLSRQGWQLDPQFYANTQAVDLSHVLSLAGELPIDIFQQRAHSFGLQVCYDGHSLTALRSFFQHQLDRNVCYFLQTRNPTLSNGQVYLCYYDNTLGWILEDGENGRRLLADLNHNLTPVGRSFLAEYADWGPSPLQHSLLFIDATPRRIAMIAEYILRLRYYGQQEADRLVSSLRYYGKQVAPHLAQHDTFTPRPVVPARPMSAANHQLFLQSLPALQVLPSTPFDLTYADILLSTQTPSHQVSYENASTDRALAALVSSPADFSVDHSNVLNSEALDLANILIQAGELGSNGVFSSQSSAAYLQPAADSFIDYPSQISTFFQQLDRSRSYVLRVGANASAGRYMAQLFDSATQGWYFYGRANEMQIGAQGSEAWFLLIDGSGNLTQAGSQILTPSSASWGRAANQFSIQLIEATEPRQQLLRRYVYQLRHVSRDAAAATIAQHRLRQFETRMIPVPTLPSMQPEDNNQRWDDLLDLIDQDGATTSSSATPSAPDLSQSIRLQHIAHLDTAIANPHENHINKMKYKAVKQVLENRPVQQIIYDFNQARTNLIGRKMQILSFDQSRLDALVTYYLTGGLRLLRGYLLVSTRALPYDVEVIHQALNIATTNPSWSDAMVLRELRERLNEDDNESTRTMTPSTIGMLIVRAGYSRQIVDTRPTSWRFNQHLTPNLSTANLQFPSAPSSSTQKRKTPTGSPAQPASTTSKRPKRAATGISFLADLRLSQIAQLQAAINSPTEKPENKLKFKAVLECDANLSLIEQARRRCALLAASLNISPISINRRVMQQMRQYFLIGGIPLLRGYSELSQHYYRPEIMQHALNLVATNTRLTLSEIRSELERYSFAHFGLRSVTPTDTELNQFLLACGYTWNQTMQKWEK